MAALAVVALLTGLAAVSLRGLTRHADAEALLDRLVALDATARQRAMRDDQPWLLVFDFERQRAWTEPALETTGRSMSSSQAEVWWTSAVPLTAVQYLSGDAVTDGQAVVLVHLDGRSAGYALEASVRSAAQESPSPAYAVVIAGETGQALAYPHPEAVDAVVAATADARADAR